MGSWGHDGIVEHYTPPGSKWKHVVPRDKLEPCPKCGAEQNGGFEGPVFWYAGMDAELSGYCISCRQCDYVLEQRYKTPQEAVNAWNKR